MLNRKGGPFWVTFFVKGNLYVHNNNLKFET